MAYETEEQQVEAIKSFWKENGNAIILGAIIGFGGLFGWKYYQSVQKEQAEMASESYNQAIAAITAGQAENPEFVAKASELIKAYPDTSYATMAALKLAQQYVEQDKYAEAEEQLAWVADKGNETFKSLAQVRLAKVLLQQEKYAEAQTVAAAVEFDANKATSLLLQGEALLGQDKKDEAIAMYKQAKEASDGAVEPLLSMRLTEFGIK
ncbi:tetratricopeptide repeat protein [Kangiella sp. HZ709]|uniref:YfgM family protein n=1 Tax=Kangiella sp. HZ709 TaxID=2666328 RepID=UPI0012AFB3D3|nr:tetratricopeptide repeat protein [Kangiella sp. HZ709]MRX27316.1 tetratricopeptide repeat protein [Kangiella sp. HZ709]